MVKKNIHCYLSVVLVRQSCDQSCQLTLLTLTHEMPYFSASRSSCCRMVMSGGMMIELVPEHVNEMSEHATEVTRRTERRGNELGQCLAIACREGGKDVLVRGVVDNGGQHVCLQIAVLEGSP